MTSSPSAARKGSQQPRIESYPLFNTTAADDAIDIASMAGLVLDPWQEHILRGSLGERVDGRWSAFRTCVVVPRQNGKNALIEARELAGLLLFGEQTIIHTAHEFKTAYKSMLALMNRLRTSPLMEYVKGFDGELADIRDIDGFKTGNTPGITMKNGNQISYAARSKGSGRGFTGDLVILDEAYALKSAEMDALLPTMAAKSIDGNPQVWFTSSAGMPESDLLESMRQQGMAGSSPRLAYYEWSTPDDVDPLDREGWYQANPGLGYRISEEFIQDEYDTMVGETGNDEGFKRERLGIWAKIGGESVFPAGVWTAGADPKSKPGDRLVFAVEIAGNRESASIALLSYRGDELVHAEVVENRVGTSWLGSRLKELQDRWKPLATVALATGHVASLEREFKREGVRLKLIKFAQYKDACGRVFDLITQGKLRHLGDPVLTAAVDGVQQQWTQDNASWYWSRKNSDVDITPLVAVTIGVAGLEKKASRSRPVGERRKAVIL